MSVNIDPSQWRLRTAGGIPYKLLSRTGSFADQEAKATEEILIQASQLQSFVVECFPLSYEIAGTLYHPQPRRMPGNDEFITTSLKWEGFTDPYCDPFSADSAAPSGTYDPFLKVTIEYEIAAQGIESGERDPSDPKTFLEISANASGEFVAASPQGAVWEDGNDAVQIDVPATVTIPETEWTVRWPGVRWDFMNGTLMGRIRNKLGKVNSTPMSLLYDAPAETVLFLGYSMRQEHTWRDDFGPGKSPMELEFKFLEKRIHTAGGDWMGHNHFYDKATGRWRKLLVNGAPVYASANLDDIFAPTTSSWTKFEVNGEEKS